MILKVYQSPKSWIVVSTSIKKDTTLLECYHSANHFIFHHDDCEVKSSNITHSVIYLKYACTYLIGRVEISSQISVNFFCQTTQDCFAGAHCIDTPD